jgi:hypothetical protein
MPFRWPSGAGVRPGPLRVPRLSPYPETAGRPAPSAGGDDAPVTSSDFFDPARVRHRGLAPDSCSPGVSHPVSPAGPALDALAEETVRELISLLTEAAGNLPDGPKAPIELTNRVDTSNQFIDKVEVDSWATVGWREDHA